MEKNRGPRHGDTQGDRAIWQRLGMEDAPRKVFGDRVKQLRYDQGLSLAQVAYRFGQFGLPAHDSTIAKIENGTRPVSVDEVAVLASIFKVKPAALFEGPESVERIQELRRKLHTAEVAAVEAVDQRNAVALDLVAASLAAGLDVKTWVRLDLEPAKERVEPPAPSKQRRSRSGKSQTKA